MHLLMGLSVVLCCSQAITRKTVGLRCLKFFLTACLFLWLCACAASDMGAGAAGLLFFELMFVTFRTLFVALFTWPEEMLIIKKVRPCYLPYSSAGPVLHDARVVALSACTPHCWALTNQ